jgi:hypothetical protein
VTLRAAAKGLIENWYSVAEHPEESTVTNNHIHDAADLCALIARGVDGVTAEQLPGRAIYAYGTNPGDAIRVPRPTSTIVLVVSEAGARWFEVDVREIDTRDPLQAYRLDFDILISLARRAGISPPY